MSYDPNAVSLLNPQGFRTGLKINGIGDSITALGQYTPYPPAGAQTMLAWQPNTLYVAGNTRKNGNGYYFCTVGGTSAASGGPTGTLASGIVDNTATWGFCAPVIQKSMQNFLAWVEFWSKGRIEFDQNQGRGGFYRSLYKVAIKNAGSGYLATDTITCTLGAVVSFVLNAAGGFQSVTVVDPGLGGGSRFGLTINSTTGSGAILLPLTGGSGTFGNPSGNTDDFVGSMAEVVSNPYIDIVTIFGFTNDLTQNLGYAETTSNLRVMFEGLLAAGKTVIWIANSPRTGLTTPQIAVRQRVNTWARDYIRKWVYANPNKVNTIIEVDASYYLTDGTTQSNDQPFGGSTGSGIAVTSDGLHLNHRGACALGYAIWTALQSAVPALAAPDRTYSQYDGVDLVQNPGGNMLEGLAWTASTAYAQGAIVSNDTAPLKTYACTTGGISFSSGGPTGTGGVIADGTAVWAYVDAAGRSVFQGNAGSLTTAGNMTCSGVFPSGFALARSSGTATGTIIGTIEAPWSDGTPGQRGVLSISCGSGGVSEVWNITMANGNLVKFGILAADLGNTWLQVDAEVECSAMQNVNNIYLAITDNNNSNFSLAVGAFVPGAAAHLPNSVGENIPFPDKLVLRSTPFLLPGSLPTNLTNFILRINFSLDASGGPNSASLVLKLNYLRLRRAFQS